MAETRIDYRSLMDFRGRPEPQARKGRAVQPGELEDDPDVVYNTFSPTGGFRQVHGKRPVKLETPKPVAHVPQDQLARIAADPEHKTRVRDPLTGDWIYDLDMPEEVKKLQEKTGTPWALHRSGDWMPVQAPPMTPEMVRVIEHTGLKPGDVGYPVLKIGSRNQLTWAFGESVKRVRDPRAGGSANLPRTKHGYTLSLPNTPGPDPRVAFDALAPSNPEMTGGGG